MFDDNVPIRPVNFFNNISGTRKRQMVYITNGMLGDEAVGDVLMKHWCDVLRKLGYKRVFFVANEGGMAQASLGTGGGLRCLTTVLPRREGNSGRVFARATGSKGSRSSSGSNDKESTGGSVQCFEL
ncbi:MAG: hypothetical protein QM820_39510 [Minicystis sp.]